MLPTSLNDLLATGAADAPAISAPGRTALDFRALRALIGDTLASLNAWGIGRNDRVAIVLNNGPEMAACFAACASCLSFKSSNLERHSVSLEVICLMRAM